MQNLNQDEFYIQLTLNNLRTAIHDMKTISANNKDKGFSQLVDMESLLTEVEKEYSNDQYEEEMYLRMKTDPDYQFDSFVESSVGE